MASPMKSPHRYSPSVYSHQVSFRSQFSLVHSSFYLAGVDVFSVSLQCSRGCVQTVDEWCKLTGLE